MNHNRPVPPVTIEAMNKETRFDDCQYLNPELKEMLKCKKIFYNHIDESFILAYNNSEKMEGGHHNEV